VPHGGFCYWHHHKSLEFDGIDFFNIYNHYFKITLIYDMWYIMFEYLIVVKIISKTRLSCNYYTNGQRMNNVYIIHGSFGDIVLSHDLPLNVGCNFTYV
jgi:hypothetical protein